MKKLKRNGFTLIEGIFALYMTGLIALLCCMLISIGFKFMKINVDSQNQFAILQIRLLLSMSENIKVQDNQLECVQNHEKVYFYFDKNRIVRSPGYEIFMEGVEYVRFFEKEDCYFVSFQKENKIYTFQIY